MGCSLVKDKYEIYKLPSSRVQIPWAKVGNIPLAKWLSDSGPYEYLEIDPRMDLVTRKGRLQPWCLQGRYLQAFLPAPLVSNKIDSETKYAYDELMIQDSKSLEEWRIDLKVSYRYNIKNNSKTLPYLDTANVIGLRDETVVVQIILIDSKCEFLLIDLNTCQILATYTEYAKEQTYLNECYISPDKRQFLLKPNVFYSLKFSVKYVDDCLKLIGRRLNDYERTNSLQMRNTCLMQQQLPHYGVLSRHLRQQAIVSRPAFHPWFNWSRIAVANVITDSQTYILGIYSLKTSCFLESINTGNDYQINSLSYSPDGYYLVALFITPMLGSSSYPTRAQYENIIIYDSATLDVVHQFPIHGFSYIIIWAPESILPMFSGLGQRLLIGRGDGRHLAGVQIYNTGRVLNLKHIARMALWTYWNVMRIDDQNLLTEDLFEYIMFRPYRE